MSLLLVRGYPGRGGTGGTEEGDVILLDKSLPLPVGGRLLGSSLVEVVCSGGEPLGEEDATRERL